MKFMEMARELLISQKLILFPQAKGKTQVYTHRKLRTVLILEFYSNVDTLAHSIGDFFPPTLI